jgi:hypothetical protein
VNNGFSSCSSERRFIEHVADHLAARPQRM